jgi:hypothetical protein
MEYKRQNGNCKVPGNYENKKLADWVSTQKAAFKQGKLSDLHLSKLNELGFVWGGVKNNRWNQRYSELVLFKQKYGHCLVPRPDKRYRQLAEWVCGRRKDFKQGKMSKERIDKLNAVGFVWVARRARYKLDDYVADDANDSDSDGNKMENDEDQAEVDVAGTDEC